jgi:hypothetical protein
LDAGKAVAKTLNLGLEKALQFQQPMVRAHVARMRSSRTDATPAEIIKALEKHFLVTVGVSGRAREV